MQRNLIISISLILIVTIGLLYNTYANTDEVVEETVLDNSDNIILDYTLKLNLLSDLILGNEMWNEGEKFTDANGNEKYDHGEDFKDISINNPERAKKHQDRLLMLTNDISSIYNSDASCSDKVLKSKKECLDSPNRQSESTNIWSNPKFHLPTQDVLYANKRFLKAIRYLINMIDDTEYLKKIGLK